MPAATVPVAASAVTNWPQIIIIYALLGSCLFWLWKRARASDNKSRLIAIYVTTAWLVVGVGSMLLLQGPVTLINMLLFGVSAYLWWLEIKKARAGGGNGFGVLRGSAVGSTKEVMEQLHGKDATALATSAKAVNLGGVVVPSELENQHFLFAGTTGSGKTQGIIRVLQAVRRRGKRALIADAGGGFLSRLYAPGDVIFNPFDSRSVDWSPFADIRADYDCQRMAKAAIPDGTGDSAEWHHYAQTLLGEVLLAMHTKGERSVKLLLNYLSVADVPTMALLLAGTPAAILCAKGNDKMLSNTRGIISTYMTAWRYLPDTGQFSIRDWVRADGANHWVFVTYRDDQSALLRALVSTLLELAIVEGLSLSEDTSRDLWYVFDEVDSLGKVSSLRSGLTKLRKYGCKCVLGLQTISQLRSTYGKDEAQTLLGNIGTKLILRAGDGETAEYFSHEIGDQEVTREQHGYSDSKGGSWVQPNNSSGSSVTYVQETKRTVLASDISGLRDLRGYLKMPRVAVAVVNIEYQSMPQVAEAFSS